MTSPELGNILITGGASGLGAATVKAVRRRGGTPLVIDVNPGTVFRVTLPLT